MKTPSNEFFKKRDFSKEKHTQKEKQVQKEKHARPLASKKTRRGPKRREP